MIKQEKGTRKQFLIINGEAVLAFVKNGQKFADCDSYTEVTANIKCKAVSGLSNLDLQKGEGKSARALVKEDCLFYCVN